MRWPGPVGDTLVGAALLAAGKAVSAVQVLLGVESRKRELATEERSLLERIFHQSLALSDIRIVEGRCGLFDVNDRPFTLGNAIYMKQTTPSDWFAVLVHEATHVWQFQSAGARYIGSALRAQFFLGSDAHGLLAYRWQREVPKPWSDLNPEAQAQVIEDLYLFGGLEDAPAQAAGEFFSAEALGKRGVFEIPDSMALHGYTAGNYTSVANDALATVRARGAGRPYGQRRLRSGR